MPNRHDPARISRRAALGAAAAAGADPRRSRQRARRPGPERSRADRPTTRTFVETHSTSRRSPPHRPRPAPGTSASPGSTSSRTSRTPPCTRRRRLSSSAQRKSELRRPSCSRTAPASPRWSSMRRIPTPTTSHVRLVCHRSSLATPAPSSCRSDEHECRCRLRHPSGLHRVRSSRRRSAPSSTRAPRHTSSSSTRRLDATHLLWGVRIGYVTADAGRFFPIDPIRVYDSRATPPRAGHARIRTPAA